MKKTLAVIAVAMTSALAFAVPTAQVSFNASSGVAQFYVNGGGDFTVGNRAPAGWYAEIIYQSGNTAYNSENYGTYGVAVEGGIGIYPSPLTFHEIGKNADGTATTSLGKTAIAWQYTSTAVNNYYATIRVYNNADKGLATKYAVLSWQQITIAPAEPTSTLTLSWTTTATRDYMKYDLTPVPEPTTMALFGLGGLALVLRRKMRKDA